MGRPRRHEAARLLLVALLALLARCGGERPPPLVPLLLLSGDASGMLAGARGALREADVAHRFVPVRSIPEEARPEWARGDQEGWVLYVGPDDRARAEEAFNGWVRTMAAESKQAGVGEAAPTALAPPDALSDARVANIQAELAGRLREDQAVRRDPARHAELEAVDLRNTAYLRALLSEVGWIDATRFGAEASRHAFLLVQHSGDVPLMRAALPRIEADVTAGRLDPQPYALLFDRLALMTGKKQRYGTQVRVREDGTHVVDRLEDPEHVDRRRAALGLGSLEDYLSAFGEHVEIER